MKKLLLSLTLALSLAPLAQAADTKAAETKAALCIGCHGIPGYQASFPEVHKVPMISGQNAKYIANALAAYKKGDRKHPTMRGIATALSEQDIADLAAFYAGHAAPAQGSAPAGGDAAKLLERGGCAACHGADYLKPIDPSYPKLAGQHADYLYVALKAYRTEANPQIGRSNGMMGGMVKQFSNAELKAIASYLSSMPGELRTVPQSRFR